MSDELDWGMVDELRSKGFRKAAEVLKQVLEGRYCHDECPERGLQQSRRPPNGDWGQEGYGW